MRVCHDSYRDPNLPLVDVSPSPFASALFTLGSELVGGGHTTDQGIASHPGLFDLCMPADCKSLACSPTRVLHRPHSYLYHYRSGQYYVRYRIDDPGYPDRSTIASLSFPKVTRLWDDDYRNYVSPAGPRTV